MHPKDAFMKPIGENYHQYLFRCEQYFVRTAVSRAWDAYKCIKVCDVATTLAARRTVCSSLSLNAPFVDAISQ